MNDDNKEHNLFDMVEGAINFYEENKGTFKSIAPDEDKVKIDDRSPLKSAHVSDEEVSITIEVPMEGIEKVMVDKNEDGVVIGMGGEKVIAEVPDDVNMDGAEANLNNGVLDVTIPREGGGE